jgi:hypothetical protein
MLEDDGSITPWEQAVSGSKHIHLPLLTQSIAKPM